MKKMWRYVVIGIVVAGGGLLFSELFAQLINGMDYGNAVNLGMGIYVCLTVVICTGIILLKLQKN